MKKWSLREWLIRLALLFAGLVVAHFGVTLFLQSGLGSDPFTVLVQGLARAAGLSVGTVHVMVTLALMAVMLLTTRGYVLPGTVVCTLFGGPIIDVFTAMVGGVLNPRMGTVLRVLCSVLGCTILACGMALVIQSDAGTGANDLVAVILADKLKKFQFRWVRMACDAAFMLGGFLLGGTLGLGTVFAVLLVGPVAQQVMPFWRRIVERCVAKTAQVKE